MQIMKIIKPFFRKTVRDIVKDKIQIPVTYLTKDLAVIGDKYPSVFCNSPKKMLFSEYLKLVPHLSKKAAKEYVKLYVVECLIDSYKGLIPSIEDIIEPLINNKKTPK